MEAVVANELSDGFTADEGLEESLLNRQSRQGEGHVGSSMSFEPAEELNRQIQMGQEPLETRDREWSAHIWNEEGPWEDGESDGDNENASAPLLIESQMNFIEIGDKKNQDDKEAQELDPVYAPEPQGGVQLIMPPANMPLGHPAVDLRLQINMSEWNIKMVLEGKRKKTKPHKIGSNRRKIVKTDGESTRAKCRGNPWETACEMERTQRDLEELGIDMSFTPKTYPKKLLGKIDYVEKHQCYKESLMRWSWTYI